MSDVMMLNLQPTHCSKDLKKKKLTVQKKFKTI